MVGGRVLFPHKLRRLLRQAGIDVNTGAQFKTCRRGQAGEDLDIPVIIILLRIPYGSGADDQIVIRIAQPIIHLS